MLRCVTRPPAWRQGPTPFLEIQVSDLLDLQILTWEPEVTSKAYTQGTRSDENENPLKS
jgi:hypothetical protein